MNKKKRRNELFNNVDQQSTFRLIHGAEINNITGLADAFSQMSDDVFHYHVTQDKNDFSNWVKGVFQHHDLASELESCSNQIESENKVLRFVMNRLME